jgi:hypothetical protein
MPAFFEIMTIVQSPDDCNFSASGEAKKASLIGQVKSGARDVPDGSTMVRMNRAAVRSGAGFQTRMPPLEELLKVWWGEQPVGARLTSPWATPREPCHRQGFGDQEILVLPPPRRSRLLEPCRHFLRVSDGARTHDRLDHNQELYQLSYAHHGLRTGV